MGKNPNSLIKGGIGEQGITSKDAIDKSEICWRITLPNSNESFRVYSLDVRSGNKETKTLTHLYVPVLRADKIGLIFGILLTSSLRILDKPYKTPGC